MRLILALLLMVAPAWAEDEAGVFDYYVLSLSWSPSWCVREGEARGNPQCDLPLGFVLHGLWPQYERGWPQDCLTSARNPSRSQTAAMADIMGSGGSAWYQWQKHGRCSGLSATDYFDTARAAFDSIERPSILRQVEEVLSLSPLVIEEAFVEANPDLAPDMITVTCRDRLFHEARICLTRDLEPRICGRDVIRDCTRTVDFLPVR